MSHVRHAVITSLVAIVLATVLAAPTASVVAEEVTPEFTLEVFHFNDGESDLLGETEGDVGSGSIARFATVLADLRTAAVAATHGHVTVSAGDNYLAGPELAAGVANGTLYDAIALDALDVDAYTIGNHEFDFGPQFLADFIEDFETVEDTDVFVSANLDFSGEPALQALVTAGRIAKSRVVSVDGEDIGIVGATTPELFEVSSPGAVVVADVYAAGEAPMEGINRDSLVAGLRERGHRTVIALDGPDSLAGTINDMAGDGDYVVCLGAGSISTWANALPGELEALRKSMREAANDGS